MAELTGDQRNRPAFPDQLDSHRVPQRVRMAAMLHPRLDGQPGSQRPDIPGLDPAAAPGAEQPRRLKPGSLPRTQPGPDDIERLAIDTDRPALIPLAVQHPDRAAAEVNIDRTQVERLRAPEPAPP
jgi:hypothetical protein